jgi:hypothetical protein
LPSKSAPIKTPEAAAPAPAPEVSRPKPEEPEAAPVPAKPLELSQVPAPVPAPAVTPTPEPAALKTLPATYQLPQDLTLGAELTLGALRVHTLQRTGAGTHTDILTLREAMASGACTVTEHPNDGFVRVHNDSMSPVICFPGQLLIGGRRDRVIASCEIIEPGVLDYRVPVAVVEAKRVIKDSRPPSGEFKLDENVSMVDLRTRNAAIAGASAATMLKRAGTINQRFAGKEDGSIGFGLRAAEVAALAKQVSALADDRTVGYIVQDASGIIAIDFFHNHALFEKCANMLAQSYALAAGEEPTAKQVQRTTSIEGHWDGEKEFIGYAGR